MSGSLSLVLLLEGEVPPTRSVASILSLIQQPTGRVTEELCRWEVQSHCDNSTLGTFVPWPPSKTWTTWTADEKNGRRSGLLGMNMSALIGQMESPR